MKGVMIAATCASCDFDFCEAIIVSFDPDVELDARHEAKIVKHLPVVFDHAREHFAETAHAVTVAVRRPQ